MALWLWKWCDEVRLKLKLRRHAGVTLQTLSTQALAGIIEDVCFQLGVPLAQCWRRKSADLLVTDRSLPAYVSLPALEVLLLTIYARCLTSVPPGGF